MNRLALTLIIIGAINWLLIGLFEWDLVAALFGGDITRDSSIFSRIIYTIVGISGIYAIRFFFNNRIPANETE